MTEALLSLITPFTWNCIYIPFAPIELWEYTTAIQPYIIGFSKAYKPYVWLLDPPRQILENIDITHKVVVDLDDDTVSMQGSPHPSEKLMVFLKSELFQISQRLILTQKERVTTLVNLDCFLDGCNTACQVGVL